MNVTTTIRDISQLNENAQVACRLFLERCKAKGLKVLITETYRSQGRQNYLYQQGRSRPGNIVTWTKNSRHTSRRAWDICKNIKGEEYSDKSFFIACGKIADELGIVWGGNWKTPDTPHFEVGTDWKKPEEVIDLEELAKIRESLERLDGRLSKLEGRMIYNYIDENMPKWAQPTIQKLVDSGLLSGNATGLGLDDTMLRILTILDRAKVFD